MLSTQLEVVLFDRDEEELTAIRAVAVTVFGDDEPTPAMLQRLIGSLTDVHAPLPGYFVSVRLVLRWQGTGVISGGHTRVMPDDRLTDGTLRLQSDVYDNERVSYMRAGLEAAGFTDIRFEHPRGTQSRYLHFYAPPHLVLRLQSDL